MNHNLLLEWLSEAGEGTWQQFRETVEWEQEHDQTGNSLQPYQVATRMSGLGYMEIDWDEGRWSAAPPCLTLLPHAGGYGLLVGGRTRHLQVQLENATDPDVNSHVVVYRRPQSVAPDSLYVGADLGAIESLAAQLNIPFEYSIAQRLSGLLPYIDDTLGLGQTGPPPEGFEIERFDTKSGRWNKRPAIEGPGLYRSRFGRPRHWFIPSDDQHYLVDGPTGIYAELRRRNEQPLRYRSKGATGRLYRPLWAPLPLLHDRTATLCSGLAPMVVSAGDERRVLYENLPLTVARRISASLGTTLDVIG